MKNNIAMIGFLIICVTLTVVGIVLFFIDVIFAIIFSVMAAIFDMGFVLAMATSKGMALLPNLTTKATIVAKNMVVKSQLVGKVYHKRTYYKLTFETEGHIRWTFNFSLELYNAFIEGDYGTLVYKESKRKQIYYVGFQRIK